VLPDKISIYRVPIQLRCQTEDEVRKLVEHVLRHEIAHHFGISDARLRDLGVY
jgi:predicted Zn-dependent protease with MMP-like domain